MRYDTRVSTDHWDGTFQAETRPVGGVTDRMEKQLYGQAVEELSLELQDGDDTVAYTWHEEATPDNPRFTKQFDLTRDEYDLEDVIAVDLWGDYVIDTGGNRFDLREHVQGTEALTRADSEQRVYELVADEHPVSLEMTVTETADGYHIAGTISDYDPAVQHSASVIAAETGIDIAPQLRPEPGPYRDPATMD